jgi:hypothetical protein
MVVDFDANYFFTSSGGSLICALLVFLGISARRGLLFCAS